jgi:hypothetical protein
MPNKTYFANVFCKWSHKNMSVVEKFEQLSNKCSLKNINGGCNDSRNLHKYCRYWSCYLVKDK